MMDVVRSIVVSVQRFSGHKTTVRKLTDHDVQNVQRILKIG